MRAALNRRAKLGLLLGWTGVITVVALALAAAATSPLLAWRDPVYVIAGFSGVLAMVLLLVQPILAAGLLPVISAPKGRRIHRWAGAGLVLLVVIHVAGLWITSPPDVIDALLFVSATSFSAWGVVAMWAVFGAAAIAMFRKRLRPRTWRRLHIALTATVIIGSVVHALLIDGTMERFSKFMLCVLVVLAMARACHVRKVWRIWRRS